MAPAQSLRAANASRGHVSTHRMRAGVRTLAVLLFAAAARSTSASLLVRGIPRSMEAVYAGVSGQFKCLDGSASIPLSRVNDEYCDCADGSDEPGTSACANGRFYCVNKGYRGKYIASSLVNDGVCDCCDGSDEYASRATCKNTCETDGAEWRRQQADAIQRAEAGARLREEYAAAGLKAASERQEKITTATAALEKVKAEREAAEIAVKEAEAEEERITQEKRDALATNADAALAAALHIKDFDRDTLLKLLLDHVRDTNTSDQLVERLRASSPLPGAAKIPEDIQWTDPFADAPEDYKSEAGNAARTKLTTVKADEARLDSELRMARDDSTVDFGPDMVFYKLKGPCYDLRVNQYTYTACPFGSARQDSTSLGTFSSWGKNADGTTNYSEMQFSNGQMCWNGPSRSMKIIFECGSTDALLSVDEPEKCTYSGRFSTPAVCDGKFAKELRLELDDATTHSKDEL